MIDISQYLVFPPDCTEIQAQVIMKEFLDREFPGDYDLMVYYNDLERQLYVDIVFYNDEDLSFWKLKYGNKINQMGR
jgi:hypothetical protein